MRPGLTIVDKDGNPTNARKVMGRLRGKFAALQRRAIGTALIEGSYPIVRAAQGLAPVRTGRLRGRIAPTLTRWRGVGMRVAIGPVRLSKKEKAFPYYGLFQEKGWKATGRATRRTATNPKQKPGKHYLRRAGEAHWKQTEQIFATRLFREFEAIQEAGIAAGLV